MPRNQRSKSYSRSKRKDLKKPLTALTAVILPSAALVKLSGWISYQYILIYLAVISLITFIAYRRDKQKAQTDAWRTPESTLHMMELAGGWLAAFFAQRTFRHKTQKTSFQVTFWAIAILHNLIALEYLLNWRFTNAFIQLIKTHAG
ncbi:DUF1294 domain-containing protein [Cerasicoccus fimbriatus]|uniref:DUF1294 domain-containing protein n=1 Tax=Cerasicoccus fimbriatus TaxID=3014554 RepID=UPI0022B45AC7|nr:DUF1294 domain-containing protein [Cerasicoccus sp. TK19100]